KAYQGDSVVSLLYAIAHEDVDLAAIPRGAKWDRLRAVLGRALFKDVDRRYPTAAAMSADLALALQDLGGSIDGAAASDLGLVRRAARPPPAPRPPPPAAPPPAAPARAGGAAPAAPTAPGGPPPPPPPPPAPPRPPPAPR